MAARTDRRGTPGLAPALAALVLTGAMAGFFYAYSVSVMPGLAQGPPTAAVVAMQGINEAVRNPVFFASFFPTPLVMGVAAARLYGGGSRRPAALMLLAAVVYGAGVIGATGSVHVPMNEALATVDVAASASAPAAAWSDYAPRWTAWNHLRALAAAASLALVGAAVAGLASGDRSPG